MQWRCSRCGELHDDLPFALAVGVPEPCLALPEVERDARVILGDEICVLDDARHFLRANLELPIVDRDARFVWTLWVEVEKRHFKRAKALWLRARREQEAPYPCRIASTIPGYPPTVGVPARLEPAPVGIRFEVTILDDAHPIAAAQRAGISLAQVQELGEMLQHG